MFPAHRLFQGTLQSEKLEHSVKWSVLYVKTARFMIGLIS